MEQRCRKKRKLDCATTDRKLAAIERLPLELLEPIFLESKNVHLLHTSKYLRLRLSSDNVKKAMVLRCFRSPGLSTDDYDPSIEWMDLESASNSTAEETYEEAISDLTALLNEEWLTMSIVKDTVVYWLWQRADCLLRAALEEYGFPASDYEPAAAAVKEALIKSTSTMTLADVDFFRATMPDKAVECMWSVKDACYPWLVSWPNQQASTKICIHFVENPWNQMTALGYIRCVVLRKDTNQVTSKGNWAKGAYWLRLKYDEERFINWTSSFQILPPRLLEGPWTQDRGDLLKFCIDQCTDVHLDTEEELSIKQTRAAQRGLRRAIRDGNFLATYMLLGRCSPSCQGSCTHYVLRKGFVSDSDLPAECGPSLEEPWRHLSWDQTITRSLNIPLKTEHLEDCLRSYATYPASSIQLLDHLGNPETKVPLLPPAFVQRFKRAIYTRPAVENTWCDETIRKSEWSLLRQFEASLAKRASWDQGPSFSDSLQRSCLQKYKHAWTSHLAGPFAQTWA